MQYDGFKLNFLHWLNTVVLRNFELYPIVFKVLKRNKPDVTDPNKLKTNFIK